MTRRFLRCLVLAALGALAALPAASGARTLEPTFSVLPAGFVRGRILFYNNQGNFCPTTRDCTDARYTQAEFNVNLPVRETKVVLKSESGSVIGQGVTDAQGWFTIGWTGSVGTSKGSLEWYAEHKDGRFAVRSGSGARWVFWTYPFSITAGTSKTAPQSIGSFTWGNAAAPHAIANLYDGAYRMWADSLAQSSRMRSSFTGIEIRAFDAARCPTSCATAENLVVIDSAASAFSPQGRILHELGHVATRLAKSYRFCGAYGRNSSNGWNLTSEEWACASFNEGIATFFGDVAIYGPGNGEPHTCISSVACADDSFDVEASSNAGGCTTAEARSALSVVRYLRDLYDTSDDDEQTALALDDVFGALAAFPNGLGERQVDEPWSADDTVGDADGRSARDFRGHLEAEESIGTSTLYTRACSPVGDF